ncbi:MAG: gylcosyl transferase-like protein, partial [Pseudomonadota bacterium]
MPEASGRLRVLVIAPYLNGDGLGEVYSIFQLVETLAREVDLTVLTVNNGKIDLAAQLPAARVVTFTEPAWLNARFRRINMLAKPWMPVFFAQARRWLKAARAAGSTWDVAHQVLPQAMRYASPLRGLGIPYVIGPLGGSLETPEAFRAEVDGGGLLTRLRGLDRLRLRHDPWLRHGLEDASVVLGVAPYIAETLAGTGVAVQRFEPFLERAHEGAVPEVTRTSGPGEAHLLHVGRGVRTKGLRDVVRALARL